MLFPDDQQRQRRRDIQGMERRLDELDDEEAREISAITERYADVKPHTTAAAIVFALTARTPKGGRTDGAPFVAVRVSLRTLPICTASGWSWLTPMDRSWLSRH